MSTEQRTPVFLNVEVPQGVSQEVALMAMLDKLCSPELFGMPRENITPSVQEVSRAVTWLYEKHVKGIAP
jgi:hypothetical protein